MACGPPPRARSRATLDCVTRPRLPADSGWFITIEGPEGAGKTTQAARLESYLRDAGLEVLRTREPGGTTLGERIRSLLLDHGAGTATPAPATSALTDALLFSAARRQLVDEVIRPRLAAGTTVICTRYADSTLAYQGHGAGVPLADLRALELIATDGLRPDLTVLLDLPAEVGLARKAPDDQTRFELGFDLEFHRRVRAGFLDLASAEPDRFSVVDATGSPESVWAAIRVAVDNLRGAAATSGEPERPVERISR
jgi:dTMP kinase